MPQLPQLSSCRPGLSRGLLQSWVPSEPDPVRRWGGSGAPLPTGPEFLLIGGAENAGGLLELEVLVVLELHSRSS